MRIIILINVVLFLLNGHADASDQTDHVNPVVDALTLDKAMDHLDLPFEIKPSSVNFDHIRLEEVPIAGASSVWCIGYQDMPIVTFSMMLRQSGSAFEPKGKRGLLRLLVAMFDEGAGAYTCDEFKKLLIEHHIKLIVMPDQDTLTLGFSVPKASVEKAFEVLKLILTSLRLEERELKKVKGQITVHLQQLLDNEEQRAEEALKQHLLHDHPYVVTIKEQLQDLSAISSKDLKAFTQKMWTRDRIIMSAVGGITPQDLKKYVEDMLSSLPEKGDVVVLDDAKLFDLGKQTHVTLDVPQTTILFAQKGIKRNDPDYFAHELALEILGSGDLGCRLMKRIREEKGLVYGIVAASSIQHATQLIMGRTSTRTQTVNDVITLIKDEWSKLIETGVTEKELLSAKKRMNGLFLLRLDNTLGLARTLLGMQYYDLGKDYLTKRAEKINSVTLSAINAVIKKHFSAKDLTFVTVGR